MPSAAQVPRIWFAPLPPMPPEWWRPYIGSTDYESLFEADARWSTAAEALGVFKFNAQWVLGPNGASASELGREVAWLNAHHVAIGFEYEPLVSQGCEGGEGFGGGVSDAIEIIRRLERAGGTVRVIAFDEPFAGGHLAAHPGACQWSIERTAQELARFVDGVHATYPMIEMGDIEPWPWASTALLADWLDAYRSAAGSDFAFLHLDVDWRVFTSDEWATQAHEVALDVNRHGARFGVIYNGCDRGCDGQTDERWLARAQRNVLDYELAGFGPPDDVVFQSWEDKPDRVLPETDPATFTHLLAAYQRPRPSMTATSAPGAGGVRVSGEVRAAAGGPAPVARVSLTAVPASGSYAVYGLDGSVPDGQQSALIALRTNTEGAGPAPANVRFYELGYTEGAGPANLLPNPRFAHGPWEWTGDGRVRVVSSDHGGGRMLRLQASDAQSAIVNSATFSVTPGKRFHVWAAARVPERSISSTLVYLIFLGRDGSETTRIALRLNAQPMPLGSTTLEADGSYDFAATGLPAGRYRLVADYQGDATQWPARARIEVSIP